MDINLNDLERLLAMALPLSYRDFVSNNEVTVFDRGFDPKTVAVLNLNLRSGDTDGWTENKFFLSGDGCGNYYFVSESGGKAKVLLWAHDPPGIEDPGISVTQFLKTYEQSDRISRTLEPGYLCIVRTECIGESILKPITLNEWKDAISNIEGIQYVGVREAQNPFTGETVVFNSPGMAVVDHQGGTARMWLMCGRVVSDNLQVEAYPIANALAKYMKANLYVGG